MISGKILRDAIISGANNINNQRSRVDELNVFPVPDGDTGTNMGMTVGAAVRELQAMDDSCTVGEAAKTAASAMLRGARGNSGVITSLLFRGFSKALEGKKEADAADIVAALKKGVEGAYKAVMKPTEGTILKNGNPLHGPGPDRVVVFQKHALFPWFTAFENVAYGLHRRKLPAKDRQTRVEYVLNMVGLSDFSQAYPASLSGGMCQRVALARALVLRPDILLLDEPFASLDAVTRIRLQDELLQLWECHGWTVILVTHNLDEAVYMADRVALLYPPPQGLKRVLTVDIPRTRSRNNAKVKEISGRLAQDLGADACNLQLEENSDA